MTTSDPSTTPPAKSASLMRVAKIMWVVIGIVVALIVLGSVLKAKKDPSAADGSAAEKTTTPASAATEVKAPASKPPLAANAAAFEAAIPLLKQVGHVVGKDNTGNATYAWSKVSVTGMSNSLTLRDADHDAKPESGMLMLATAGAKNDTVLEAVVLAQKVVSVASGETVDGKAFAEWFATVLSAQKVPPRTFGTVTVSLGRTAIGADSIIFVGLNQ